MTARLSLRVSPGAPRPSVLGRHGTGWKIARVTAGAREDGKGERRVVRLACSAERACRRVTSRSSRVSRRADKYSVLAGIDSDGESQSGGLVAGMSGEREWTLRERHRHRRASRKRLEAS